MLVSATEMINKAHEGHYAIGAFNINNLEWTKSILAAAEEAKSPVMLGVSEGAAKYMCGFKTVVAMVKEIHDSMGITVPVALHLDHGSYEGAKACIEAGFTSVMFDGSHYDYEENVAKTKEVVDYAHAHGVVVEAELGKLAGVEDEVSVAEGHATYTDPDQALDFVQRTGVDSLAVAIGTSHGAYKFKGDAKLDFDRLAVITEKLENAGFKNYPIVLHGASSVDPDVIALCNKYGGDIKGAKGIPYDMLRKASSMAVCKINMDTDIRLAMTAAVREFMAENPDKFDPRGYLGAAREKIQALVENKIKNVLGSENSMN